MLKQKNTLISLAVSLLVASCGGGGGGDSSPAPIAPAGSNGNTSTTAGKVVDGYIAGAAVFCDTNNNGVRDAGEQTVLTDAQGSFTFSTACSSTIVASGGTDTATGLPFRGVLKAPPGSTVVTAGTSLLVNSSLARERLATALGLTAGTDITALDPAAIGTGGTLANASVLQRTLAIQQVVQQIADAIASLLPNHTPEQTQALYAETTNAAGKVLQASSSSTLVGSTGTVDPATVNAIAQQALTNAAASTDARLAEVKAALGSFSSANLAALIAPAIAAQAQSLATSANSDSLTRTTQSDSTVADAVRQVAAMLKTAVSNNVNLSTAAASLRELVSAATTEAKAAAILKLSSDIDLQAVASAAGGELIAALLNAPSSYLDVVANVIRINGHEGFDLGDLASNKVSFTATGPATINTVSIQVDPNDMKPDTGSRTIPVSVAFQLADTGGSGQLVQFEIDKVNLSINAQNQVSASIPSDAKLYVYGKNAAGASTTLTLNPSADLVTATSTAPATPTSSPTNIITINPGAALAQAAAANSAVFSGLQTLKGKLDMKLVLSNVEMRQAGKLPVPNVSVLVNGADQPAVTGPGFEGVLTVQ